jgi:hypothetical protein
MKYHVTWINLHHWGMCLFNVSTNLSNRVSIQSSTYLLNRVSIHLFKRVSVQCIHTSIQHTVRRADEKFRYLWRWRRTILPGWRFPFSTSMLVFSGVGNGDVGFFRYWPLSMSAKSDKGDGHVRKSCQNLSLIVEKIYPVRQHYRKKPTHSLTHIGINLSGSLYTSQKIYHLPSPYWTKPIQCIVLIWKTFTIHHPRR